MFSRLKKNRLLYGLLVAPVFMLGFFAYAAYLGRSDTALLEAFCRDLPCECEDWYRDSAGLYQVENNVWNKGKLESYQQCVFLTADGEDIRAGWAWNWPGTRFNVVAYPNLLYGKNPWLPATSAELPRRIDEIQCLEAAFDIVQEGRGKRNLAFDLWITDSQVSNPAAITHEVMIWLSRGGFPPAGSRVETFEIDGREVELWVKENHNPSDENAWTFLALVHKNEFTAGTVDLHATLDRLVEGGHLPKKAYLSSIQLGNEIVSGYGGTYINQFEVRFCDP